MYHPNYYYGPGWGAGGLMFGLLHFLFWVLILLFIFRFLRRGHGYHGFYGGHGGWHNNDTDPLQIAKTRFAKGEITKDELEEIKKTLS